MNRLRCKMKVHEVKQERNPEKGDVVRETLRLGAVGGDTPENKAWASASPQATLYLVIENPAACGRFLQGQEVFVDLTLVPAPAELAAATAGG